MAEAQGEQEETQPPSSPNPPSTDSDPDFVPSIPDGTAVPTGLGSWVAHLLSAPTSSGGYPSSAPLGTPPSTEELAVRPDPTMDVLAEQGMLLDAKFKTLELQSQNCTQSFDETDAGTSQDVMARALLAIDDLMGKLPRKHDVKDAEVGNKWDEVRKDLATWRKLLVNGAEKLSIQSDNQMEFFRVFMDLVMKMKSSNVLDCSLEKYDPNQYGNRIQMIEECVEKLREGINGIDSFKTDLDKLSFEEPVWDLLPRESSCIGGVELAMKAREGHHKMTTQIFQEDYAQKQTEALKKRYAFEISEKKKLIGAKEALIQDLEQLIDLETTKSKELDGLVDANVTEKRASMAKILEDTDAEQKAIREKRAKTQEDMLTAFDKRREERDERRAELTEKLMDLDETPNHIIFLLDKSYSMEGAPWAAMINAYERFIALRVQAEATDRVSVVCFSDADKVNIEFQGRDVGSGTTSIRQNVPDGGTAFQPPWAAAQRLATSTQNQRRTIVIFMTDGMASDIAGAARVAGTMYKKIKDMTTFVVEFGQGCAVGSMDEIVKQGNGGHKTYAYEKPDGTTEHLPLSMKATCSTIAEVFEKISQTVDLQEATLHKKLGRIETSNSMEMAWQKQSILEVDEIYNVHLEEKKKAMRALKESKLDDLKVVDDLLVAEKERQTSKLVELQQQLDGRRSDLEKLTQEKLELDAKHESLAKQFESQEEATEEETLSVQGNTEALLDGLKRLQKQEGADMLKRGIDQRDRMIENTGISDKKEIQDLQDALKTAEQAKHSVQLYWVKVRTSSGSIVNLLSNMADALRKPACEATPTRKFDFMVKHLKLPITENSVENLKAVLKQIAIHLECDPDDAKKAILAIARNFTAEELCGVSSLEDLEKRFENQPKEKSQKFGERLRDAIAKESAQARKLTAKLQTLEEKKKKWGKELRKVNEELEEVVADEDMEEELREKKREKLDERRDTLTTRVDEILEEVALAAEELEEQVGERVDCAKALIRHFVDEFLREYLKGIVAREKRFLIIELASIHTLVYKTIKCVKDASDGCVEAIQERNEMPMLQDRTAWRVGETPQWTMPPQPRRPKALTNGSAARASESWGGQVPPQSESASSGSGSATSGSGNQMLPAAPEVHGGPVA